MPVERYQTKEDRDALLKAINEEFMWEYHPFLPLQRHLSHTQAPEPAILYRPPTVPSQMWLFTGVPLLPIETVEIRVMGVMQTSGKFVMFAHNASGVSGLFEQGWVLAPNALRLEGVRPKEGE